MLGRRNFRAADSLGHEKRPKTFAKTAGPAESSVAHGIRSMIRRRGRGWRRRADFDALAPFRRQVVVVVAVALSLLELFVACLQAYVFTFLAALFIGAALHPH